VILRARVVLPISQAPLENGALFISGNRIAAVGPWHKIKAHAEGEIVDLGDSILLPGLINAHCHLDYTDMAGQIARPKNFPDWIKAILALKANWSYTDFANSWLHGAKMLLESGTTTVADIEAVPELLPDTWSSTPLRVLSFLEMTSVRSGRSASEILDEAVE
jgi:cytosine/adenosine deaminase-related metal-dependent hydrolase